MPSFGPAICSKRVIAAAMRRRSSAASVVPAKNAPISAHSASLNTMPYIEPQPKRLQWVKRLVGWLSCLAVLVTS